MTEDEKPKKPKKPEAKKSDPKKAAPEYQVGPAELIVALTRGPVQPIDPRAFMNMFERDLKAEMRLALRVPEVHLDAQASLFLMSFLNRLLKKVTRTNADQAARLTRELMNLSAAQNARFNRRRMP